MPTLAVFVWPLISMGLFNVLGRTQGLIWATLVGALFLPENYSIDLPGLPPYDKLMAIVVGTLLGLAITRNKKKTERRPAQDTTVRTIILLLCAILLLSSFTTVLNNTEAVVIGSNRIDGLGLRDIITMTSQVMVLVVPFLIARRYLADPHAHTLLLGAFVTIGLAYSLLILVEVRFSPQLHRWVYGYFQHRWGHHVRGGTFRPAVFQPHALWIGILVLTCAMSAFVLFRQRNTEPQKRRKYLLAGFWFLLVLVLCRNFAALLLAMAFAPMVWFFTPRVQVASAMVIVIAFMIHPMLRQSGIVTLHGPLSLIERVAPERVGSMYYRLDNETLFLERAAKKPVTGWGIWARWRVRDETGRDISTSDGRWISVLGERGWIGFIGYFGMIFAPILFLPRAARHRPTPQQTSGIALIMAATLIYQIPNNTIGPITLLMAGALAGYVERRSRSGSVAEDAVPVARDGPRYTRFPAGSAPETPNEAAGGRRVARN